MRAFARRRPDVDVAVLRFTNFIGPRIDSLLTGFFRMPVVPTALGYDARVQLLHEDDALAVLTRATTGDFVGTVNVGGEGTLLLSQAIRRLGRVEVPLPTPALGSVGRLSRRFGFVDYSPEQMRFLNFGRVVDTTVLRDGVRLHAPLHDGGRAGRLRPHGAARGLPAARASRRPSRVRVGARARRRRRDRGRRAAAPGPAGARPPGGARCLRPASSRCVRTTTSPTSRRRRRPAGRSSSPAGWSSCAAALTGEYETDEFGFDPDLTDHVLLPLLRPLFQKWFRVESQGLENVPSDAAARCVVANHSGTVPVDALMTTVALHDDHPAQRRLRLLGADLVFDLPFIGSMSRKMGSTLACNEDAERLLTDGRAGRRLPRGLQGHRQAVPRAVHAAAVRSRAVSSQRLCAPGCRSSRARSWAPRRSTR